MAGSSRLDFSTLSSPTLSQREILPFSATSTPGATSALYATPALDASPAPDATATSPVLYLIPYLQYGVIICTEHRSGYTAANLHEHVYRAHRLKGALLKNVVAWAQSLSLPPRVSLPPNYSPPFPELNIESGYRCNVAPCTRERCFLTTYLRKIEDHCRDDHNIRTQKRLRQFSAIRPAQLQTPLAKNKPYFIIQHPIDNPPAPPAFSPLPAGSSQEALDSIRQRFDSAQKAHLLKYRTVQGIQHPAEVTPFLRVTHFHEHTQGLEADDIASSYGLPEDDIDSVLYQIGQSVQRILLASYHRLSFLHHVDARRLNTFQPGALSQHPLERLQEKRSRDYYIAFFTKFICFFYRVHHEQHFDPPLFQTTAEQNTACHDVVDTITRHLDERQASQADRLEGRSATAVSEDPPVPVAAPVAETDRIDRGVLSLCIALVQSKIDGNQFDNALISFSALASRDLKHDSWHPESTCSSQFGQLIYCGQLIILADAKRRSDEQPQVDFATTLTGLCSKWVTNDTRGPISDLNRYRLYAITLAKQQVRGSHIRWHADNETLTYMDITYKVSFLATEIAYYLDLATQLLEQDLCLGLTGIPAFDLTSLVDNWDNVSPGQSFLQDIRNAGTLAGFDTWLRDRILASPELAARVFRWNTLDVSHPTVRSDFAAQFEQSVQRWLEPMAVAIHKGSGQPARITEFFSLRLLNNDQAVRNLFVHDGFLLFVLSYHKSLSRTHASRYPVRFLLPRVSALLLRFLVLVQPFRRFLSQETRVPTQVSEYLWHDGEKLWPESKMARISSALSRESVGVAVNSRSWRQITVGIAIKKFSGMQYAADVDLPGDPGDDFGGLSILEGRGGAMADVFHHQAAHTPETGNRHYGGTINFKHGLTDAALHEYFRASRLWHSLCDPSLPPSLAGHRREASTPVPIYSHPPLFKRLDLRQQVPRHQHTWGPTDIQRALRQVFPGTNPTFRSSIQEQALNGITSGAAEVILVLGPGEGKSLAFLLPPCLPNAGTTVVIVPLVALKSDLVRRCREAHLAHTVWDSQQAESFTNSPLVFVSIEQALKQPFLRLVGRLDASERLDRIVFDEAHLIVTAIQYRPVMALAKRLRAFRCQFVFLTGTLPPLLQTRFHQAMLLDSPAIYRAPTFRNDLNYSLLRSSTERELEKYALSCISQILKYSIYLSSPHSRMIVYTSTRQMADRLGASLGLPVYYSNSADTEDKEAAVEQWRSGQSKAIVATNAFGAGIDYPAVRHVLHIGPPQDIIGFAQEVGRAGRDHQHARSYILLAFTPQSPSFPPLREQQLMPVEEVAMTLYIRPNRCLRAVLSRFLDGPAFIQYCTGTQARRHCSSCLTQGIFDPTADIDTTVYWDSPSPSTPPPPPAPVQPPPLRQNQPIRPLPGRRDGHQDLLVPGPTIIPAPSYDAGPDRFRAHERNQARDLSRFMDRLRSVQGLCLFCKLMGVTAPPIAHQEYMAPEWHSWKECQGQSKWDLRHARTAALQRHRGKWFEYCTLCTMCYLPQSICSRDPASGPRECEFRDIILPAAFCLFHQENRWGMTLQQITQQPRTKYESEIAWMDWLAEPCEVYGMRACRLVEMADWVLKQIVDTEPHTSTVEILGN